LKLRSRTSIDGKKVPEEEERETPPPHPLHEGEGEEEWITTRYYTRPVVRNVRESPRQDKRIMLFALDE
jgi:hypothetical protein